MLDEKPGPILVPPAPISAPEPSTGELPTIGRLQRVPLREVWRHEAASFTTWLRDNIEVLNEVLDLSLANAEREQPAGAFSVDIVAEDGAGNAVIIENQLEKSDHDHLGKLITYLSAFEAKKAVWIVADPRPEHVRAVTWLNESTSASFYLLKVEAVRIDASRPAPLLTLITGPSEETVQVSETKRELAEHHHLRRRFWTALLETARSKTRLHANVSPSHNSWIPASAGRTGLAYVYVAWQHQAGVELYIDRGKDAESENRAVFELFMASKEDIEAKLGGPLEWQPLEGKRSCRIRKTTGLVGNRDEEKWPEIHQAMIDAMIHLEEAFRPYIARLPARFGTAEEVPSGNGKP
jgi:hypothetical protein